ncbi:FBD-associated F-box protein At5g38590-like isoform X1 [Apium graveolens]|uniref:FBD-associated F-box protein At5g38590-like isoform X1 n=1 Tax=Apium graveolens TaxID=4045 RepID=UPI003D7B4D44
MDERRRRQYILLARAEKKLKRIKGDEDRISGLPDELIHKIYSHLDAKEAVQSSVLSKRWKLIWTTLPFLGFGRYDSLPFGDVSRYTMLIRHVLSNRNHQSPLFELKMYVPHKLTVNQSVSREKFRGCVVEKFIQYAISHNVQELNICYRRSFGNTPFKLFTLSSNSIKKLKLDLLLREEIFINLPALTTLHLKHPYSYDVKANVLESLLTSLPALRSLRLDSSDLSEISFSFPNLTILHLLICTLPRMVWHLPALSSLHMEDVNLPKNMSDMFSTLVNLKHLTLYLGWNCTKQDHSISCPQLLNLNIRAEFRPSSYGKIVVSAPLLCNFSSLGIFSIKVEAPELENVNIKLKDWFSYGGHLNKKKYYQGFTCMLSGLGTAKNISFDLESIKALSEIINIQASVSSPFINLKYLKLPMEYKESSLSSALRSYLLGGSPRATIVSSVAQNRIHQPREVSVAAENVVLQEPLAAPTKVPCDCQYVNKTVTVDMGVQERRIL